MTTLSYTPAEGFPGQDPERTESDSMLMDRQQIVDAVRNTFPQVGRRQPLGSAAVDFYFGQQVIAPRISEEVITPMSNEMLALDAKAEVSFAVDEYRSRIAQLPSVEPVPGERLTTVSFREIVPPSAPKDPEVSEGWRPGQAFLYSSNDPYHALNPGHVDATADLIDVATRHINRLRITREPTLTYLKGSRGKRPTIITEMIKAIDPGIEEWINILPAAPGLRPVAKPWSDEPLITQPKGAAEPVETPTTPALRAFVGGGLDGRAVREREAWERSLMSDFLEQSGLTGNTLTISSLGTGTGEPVMDTALEALKAAAEGGNDYKVTVHGYDFSQESLDIAKHVAGRKDDPEHLEFVDHQANILTAEGIEEAVGNSGAQVFEAIGFTEYVASDNAPTEVERKTRESMKRMGCLSAQDFYKKIYENMPAGSVFLTGNMRNDSPQGEFITDGLGWPGIIPRSTDDYLRILSESGIPGEAVRFYMPDQTHSAASYNLVAITKL